LSYALDTQTDRFKILLTPTDSVGVQVIIIIITNLFLKIGLWYKNFL